MFGTPSAFLIDNKEAIVIPCKMLKLLSTNENVRAFSWLFLLLFLTAAPLHAGYQSDEAMNLFSREDSESEEIERWKTSPHHLSILQAWTFAEDGENAFTLGLDYEYRLNSFLGLGGVLEYAFEPFDTTTVIAAADLHLTDSSVIQTGPGFVGDDQLSAEVISIWDQKWRV